MRIKKLVCVLFLFATVCMSNVGLAQDKETKDAELAELKQQIIELQRQMHEVKGKHESQINSLKEKVKELSERAGAAEEAGTEDEMARLRAMAEKRGRRKEGTENPRGNCL